MRNLIEVAFIKTKGSAPCHYHRANSFPDNDEPETMRGVRHADPHIGSRRAQHKAEPAPRKWTPLDPVHAAYCVEYMSVVFMRRVAMGALRGEGRHLTL